MTPQPGDRFARGPDLQRKPEVWRGGLIVALALLALDAPQSWARERACCGDRPHAYRPAPATRGYRSPTRGYRHRDAPWSYGYTSPARVYGDPYAAWPSTSIPPTRSYLNTATPVPNAGAIGLTMPVTSAQGLLEGGLPPNGPSLFGPDPPPWGYANGGYGAPAYGYSGAPSYGYRTVRPYGAPPADTPSWWLEPRRRR
jgi:hypothetical protein